jgi:hypothetical protein
MAFPPYVMRMFLITENLKGYAGGSIATGRVSLAGQMLYERNTLVLQVAISAGRLVTFMLKNLNTHKS